MESKARHRAAIILVAKLPIPGSVKTRLSPPLSIDEATNVYACFLRDTIENVSRISRAALSVAFNISDAPGKLDEIEDDLELPGPITVLDQGAGDLGTRLARLCQLGFTKVDKLVLIGADSPTMPVSYIEQALDMLSRHDIVIGPSDDGGYYLIGLSDNHPCLFEDIDWSTRSVFRQTLARANEAGLRVAMLPYWFDVDDVDGLHRLYNELQDDPSAAPCTIAYLTKLAGSSLFR